MNNAILVDSLFENDGTNTQLEKKAEEFKVTNESLNDDSSINFAGVVKKSNKSIKKIKNDKLKITDDENLESHDNGFHIELTNEQGDKQNNVIIDDSKENHKDNKGEEEEENDKDEQEKNEKDKQEENDKDEQEENDKGEQEEGDGKKKGKVTYNLNAKKRFMKERGKQQKENMKKWDIGNKINELRRKKEEFQSTNDERNEDIKNPYRNYARGRTRIRYQKSKQLMGYASGFKSGYISDYLPDEKLNVKVEETSENFSNGEKKIQMIKEEANGEKETKDEIKHTKGSLIFENITLCLMGMSSVLLYNYVLNTTPYINGLLNNGINISDTYFLYFIILVGASIFISFFFELNLKLYELSFVLIIGLQMIYPFVIKYFSDINWAFRLLVCNIAVTCSILKTMSFSISAIIQGSSKIICLSFGISGVYSFVVTFLFYHGVLQIKNDAELFKRSVLFTSIINCVFMIFSLFCYVRLKRTYRFQKQMKNYFETYKENTLKRKLKRKGNVDNSDVIIGIKQGMDEEIETHKEAEKNHGEKDIEQILNTHVMIEENKKKEKEKEKEKKKAKKNEIENNENKEEKEKEKEEKEKEEEDDDDEKDDSFFMSQSSSTYNSSSNTSTLLFSRKISLIENGGNNFQSTKSDKGNKKINDIDAHRNGKLFNNYKIYGSYAKDKKNKSINDMAKLYGKNETQKNSSFVDISTQKKICGKLYMSNYFKNKDVFTEMKHKLKIYKRAVIPLFCIFYNIFLKVIIFPVVCPEMWTDNMNFRYMLIGIVQIADCISRIFPTLADSVPKLSCFILSPKNVLYQTLFRTLLALLCLAVAIFDNVVFQNAFFKSILIFIHMYLNGWYVVMSFINIPIVLGDLDSPKNRAIASSFGSSFLRIGLLAGFGMSRFFKFFYLKKL